MGSDPGAEPMNSMVHAGATEEEGRSSGSAGFRGRSGALSTSSWSSSGFGEPNEVIAVGTSSNPECNEFTKNAGCAS